MRPGKENDGLPAVALWLAEDSWRRTWRSAGDQLHPRG